MDEVTHKSGVGNLIQKVRGGFCFLYLSIVEVDAAWGAKLIQPPQKVVQLGVKQEGLANTSLLTTLKLASR
jgi:hypothetical protein